MEIRLLASDDAREWWRLRLEALQGDPEAFSSSEEQHQILSLDEVRRRLSGNDSFVVGAFEDGRLTGMAGFHREIGPKIRHKGRVWGVYVTPMKRGLGAGRRILQALLQHAARIDGLEQVLLSVTSTQAAAMKLYRSLGFESFGCEPRAVKIGDQFLDEEYLLLRLHGPGVG